MEVIKSQPSWSGTFGGRDVIRKAEIDVDAYVKHTVSLSLRWSFVPFCGCIFCQPCRYCCWAEDEARIQANAISLILYEQELELTLKSHKIRCPCVGAAPPPRPYTIYATCGIVPDVTTTVPLSQIQKIALTEFQGIELLQFVYTTGQSSRPNQPAPCASITVRCVKNAKSFRDAVLQQQRMISEKK
ncbi:hypothetical protein TrispH2_002049 [Trichoplax sp. H2]|nr:hypothetical protein TrispH2_002049 [Trichoplax sp. H2]|eukprot:RDD46526.1 hypothetical protein TrispH2_002049 [Trichoplax sp. H2]